MRDDATRPRRRRIKEVTLAEKVNAVARVRAGESKAEVGRDIQVAESTLRGWCKAEDKLRQQLRNSTSPDSEALSSASSAADYFSSHSSDDAATSQRRGVKRSTSDSPTPSCSQPVIQQHREVPAYGTNDIHYRTDSFQPDSVERQTFDVMSLSFFQRSLWQCFNSGTPIDPLSTTSQWLQQQHAQMSRSPTAIIRAELDCNDDENHQSIQPLPEDEVTENDITSLDQAVTHAERLYKWLQSTSDPHITQFQVTQFHGLLEKMKASQASGLNIKCSKK